MLTMPHRDFGNKTQLSTVFTPENNQMAVQLYIVIRPPTGFLEELANDSPSLCAWTAQKVKINWLKSASQSTLLSIMWLFYMSIVATMAVFTKL